MKRRVVVCVLVAIAGAAVAVAQDADSQPTFRSGINFVRIDVVATDGRARPVTDLTEADFEILEDGRPQAIEQFRLVTVDGSVPEGRSTPRAIRSLDDEELEASREDTRVFVIFLDDYHVTRRSSMRIRETLVRFVTSELGPNDLVAIMYPLTTLGALGFTRNHDSIVAALREFEGRKCDLGVCDYVPRNPPEGQYAHYPPRQIEAIRNQVVASALQGLAIRLGSLREARKSVLYVSEGFSGGFGFSSTHEELRDLIVSANRNNVAIYALDPRGLTIGRMSTSASVLRTIAEDTGGRAIVNRNTLGEGLADMVRDASSYYMIGYSSSVIFNDGKFHDVQVRVKRRGVDLRSRKGYWALSATDAARAAGPPTPGVARDVESALDALSLPPSAARHGRAWVGTGRGTGAGTRVTVVWEPVPAGADRTGAAASAANRPEQPGGIALRAVDARGGIVFEGYSAAEAPPAPRPGAARVSAERPPRAHQFVFDAPPGELDVRLTVESSGRETLDTETRKVHVPDYAGTEAVLSTPRVFRGRTALEMRAVTSDAAAPPSAIRTFSRTERLLIRFDLYGGPGNAEAATAALMNRAGQKMADLPVSPAPLGGTHQIELALGSVPAGDYLIEIALPAAGTSRQLVAIRITS